MDSLTKGVLIVGGGTAGLCCARELHRLGVESLVMEKAPFRGGHVLRYACKATDQCQRCGACLLEDILDELAACDKTTFIVRAEIVNVVRRYNRFLATLLNRPLRINPAGCTDCDRCLEKCPAPGALVRSPLDDRITLVEEACLFFKEGSCRICAEVCPEGAVDLLKAPEEVLVETSAIVLACGFKPFDPTLKPRFGYGRIPGVVTGLELESLLRADNLFVGEGDGRIRSVAFIQCVGSRDPRIGRDYCSRVCCGYALRLARLLKKRFPGIEPAMFYMDIQTFDRDFERRLEKAAQEVRLIRSIPSEVRLGENGKPVLIYQGPDDTRAAESFDLVVLSVGMSPDSSLGTLAEMLDLKPNSDGFLGDDAEGVTTNTPGVFVCGAVQGPKSIEESVSHAVRAAWEAASYVQVVEGRMNQ